MYRSFDPSMAWCLGEDLAQTGATLAALLNRIRPLLRETDQLQLVDRSAAWWVATDADLKRRVAALTPLPHPTAGPEWTQGPPRLDDVGSPTEAAEFFSAMSPPHSLALATRFPDQVGPLDGAPPVLRYAANHLLAVRYLEELRHRRRTIVGTREAGLGFRDEDPWERSFSAITGRWRSLDRRVTDLDRRIADGELWADENRQFLRFDPSGDGIIIEVFGDLESSVHVAVVIPGANNEITNYEQGFRRNAASLYGNTNQSDAAVIAWLGYDTPDDLLAATNRHPAEAARSLSRFLAGLEVSSSHPLHVSVIGHSYGSVVTGAALQAGARVEEVVFIGSPGVGVDHVSELALPERTQVWAGRAASDPILLARDVECLDLVPICFPSSQRLFFGLDPTDPAFGATAFEVDDAPMTEAHSSYFKRGSLALHNLTSILLGQNHRVVETRQRAGLVSE